MFASHCERYEAKASDADDLQVRLTNVEELKKKLIQIKSAKATEERRWQNVLPASFVYLQLHVQYDLNLLLALMSRSVAQETLMSQ